MLNSNSAYKYVLGILLIAVSVGLLIYGKSSVQAAEPVTVEFTITEVQASRNYSYALGKLLGQKPLGSGDLINEFSIITTANYDVMEKFLGTYTVTIPSGRATTAQIQEIFDHPTPEQPPIIKTREDELVELLMKDTITLRQIAELMRLERSLP